MKKFITNIVFAISFLLIFSFISNVYFDYFIQAFTGDSPPFPPGKSFPIDECQSWTEDVRNFNVVEGEQAEQVTVLMYHRIIDDHKLNKIHYETDEKLYDTIVLKSEFEKQMNLLREEKYVTLTAKEFKLFMENKLKVPKKSILLTFDDGFKDNYIEAYPILKSHNFTAINFVVTGFVSERDHKFRSDQTQYFSLSDLKKSCSSFEFQSHTYNFHKKNNEGMAYLKVKSKNEIKNDIATSLVNLNESKRSFAYPYGEYNEETIEILKDLGIEMAFTVEYKDAKPGMNMYEIPRKAVFPEDTIEDFRLKINLN